MASHMHLTPLEEQLIQEMKLITVRGKKGKPVPVIIPPETRDALDYILENRGVVGNSEYLFGNQGNYL